MDEQKLNELFVSIGAIHTNIENINTTLEKVDKSLNDPEYGLMSRTAVLEAADGRRVWKERAIFTTLLGIIVAIIVAAL